MLNRKASNIIFYGSLLAITIIIVLIRFAMLGSLDAKIAKVESNSRYLQFLIEDVDTKVSENRGIQQDHLFELYNRVPESYNDDILINYVTAQLELVDVKAVGYDRDVQVDADPSIPGDNEILKELQDDYFLVEVYVTFTVEDKPLTEDVNEIEWTIEQFLDSIIESEQVFIISYVKFTDPDGGSGISVQIKFFAFYEK